MKDDSIKCRIPSKLKEEFEKVATDNSMNLSERMLYLIRQDIEKFKKAQKNKPQE